MARMSLGSLNISLVRLQKMMSHGFPASVCVNASGVCTN